MRKDYAVAPMGQFAVMGMWLPLFLTALALVGAALWPEQKTPAYGLFAGLPILVIVGVVLFVGARRRRIVVENRQLDVTATFYRKRVPVESIDLDRARVLNLAEHTELRPMLKTNGFNLPGFAAGHYRMRNLSKAFCLLTNRSRVLVLPLRDGPTLLLSPEKPRELLDQLRELASGPAAR